jgi:hypothetical protein
LNESAEYQTDCVKAWRKYELIPPKLLAAEALAIIMHRSANRVGKGGSIVSEPKKIAFRR